MPACRRAVRDAVHGRILQLWFVQMVHRFVFLFRLSVQELHIHPLHPECRELVSAGGRYSLQHSIRQNPDPARHHTSR